MYVLRICFFWQFNVRPLCQKNFGDRQRERQNHCQKLPENGHYFTNNLKQGDLHRSNASRGLQNMTKYPKCQEHRVEAIHVVGSSKNAILSNEP